MYAATRPGGSIVVQECDLRKLDIYPDLPCWTAIRNTLFATLETAGKDLALGLKLPVYFERAGLGRPDGTDVEYLALPLDQGAHMIESVFRTLIPRAIQYGLTSEVESEGLIRDLQTAVHGGGAYSTLAPTLIGAWKRKPAPAGLKSVVSGEK